MPYIYLASTPQWITQNIGKIGCTDEPYGRIQQYLTGCPPCMLPSCDIEFFQIWKLEDDVDKYYYENYIHEWFKLFRMRRKIDGDSEWFNFKNESILENLNSFMKTREWFVGIVSFFSSNSEISSSILFMESYSNPDKNSSKVLSFLYSLY